MDRVRSILWVLFLVGGISSVILGWIPISTEQTSWDGPLLENNQSARVEIVKFLLSSRVEIDYLDNRGKKIDTENRVKRVLDVYLQKVPKIAPFLPRSYRDGVSSSTGDKEAFPFQMYLLTISPLVVLAVPRPRAEYGAYCSGGIFSTGIIPSAGMLLDCYAYLAKPKIRPGSFWFSPDLGITGQFLPEGKSNYSINLKGSRLDLIANGDVWSVQRHIVTP